MEYRNCTQADIEAALVVINRDRYNGNICFKRLDSKRFRLGVADSKGPGARRALSGRRLTAACWHVHGDLFDALFRITPTAKVKVGMPEPTRWITLRYGGNWVDWYVGNGANVSDLCECPPQSISVIDVKAYMGTARQ